MARRAGFDGVFDEISQQKERLFVWVPVAFAFGIAVYFGLKAEPPPWAGFAGVVFTAPVVAAVYPRHHDSLRWFFTFLIAVALCAAMLGFAGAQTGTKVYGTPVLERSVGPVDVSGRVESVDDLGGKDGARVVLTDLAIERMAPEDVPKKIRLRFKRAEGLKAGARISTLAKIEPPSGAVLPGAYDFRRHLFYQGIGGVGFSLTAATVIEDETDAPVFFETMRTRIDRNIKEHAGAVTGAIMSALITGERAAIDPADDGAMRDSGLYHLLSISGTHVTMVAGVLFFFARFLMACVPWVALHWPIKKIAAVIALAGAAFYVFLAGAEVPAQRALLMTALIMVAIMMDRSPFSLRLIAFAALVVLAVAPFALVGVSFQMSFAAVAALICFFEWIRPWWMMWYSRAGFVRKAFMYVIAVCLTSVIAGGVTGLFSLYHFQSFAVYGVLSNMMAVPLTGVVIMPAAIVSLFLMPLGLEAFPLAVMEWGTVWMLAIAHWAGGLDGAVVHVRQWSGGTFACLCVGTVLFLLWEGWRGKAVAAGIVAVGLMIAPFTRFPDILVSQTGELAGIHAGEALYVSSGRKEKFVAENWMRLAGMAGERPEVFAAKRSPVRCDDDACRMELRGRKVSFVATKKGFYEDCAWADVMVASEPLPEDACCEAKVVLDLYDFKDNGAHAVYLDDLRVRSVGAEGGKRPWTDSP